jgi:simple sugar transport system permease protein
MTTAEMTAKPPAPPAPAPSAPAPATRRFGRLGLDIRQDLSAAKQAGFLAATIVVGLALSLAILAIAGITPTQVYEEMIVNTLLNPESLAIVLTQAAPLIVVGVSAGLAVRVGFWNLGLEGQMIFGGIGATAVSIYEIGPAETRLVMMGIFAAIAGMLWVMLAAWLKARFRVNEIISTLLLNYIAMYFLFHLLYGAWQDSATAYPQSALYRPFERLPDILPGVNAAMAIALVAVVIAGWFVHLSRTGFYMRFISANPSMARVVGVPIRAVSLGAIAASGALAGLAGLINVSSQEGRLTQSFSEGYVFSGVLIAFLSRTDPLIAAVVGFLIAVLFVAGQTLQVFYQIPLTMVEVIEAIIVLAVASSEFLIRHRIRWIR